MSNSLVRVFITLQEREIFNKLNYTGQELQNEISEKLESKKQQSVCCSYSFESVFLVMQKLAFSTFSPKSSVSFEKKISYLLILLEFHMYALFKLLKTLSILKF